MPTKEFTKCSLLLAKRSQLNHMWTRLLSSWLWHGALSGPREWRWGGKDLKGLLSLALTATILVLFLVLLSGKSTTLIQCWGLEVSVVGCVTVSLPNVHVEILTHEVMALGDEDFGRQLGQEGGARTRGLVPLWEETGELAFSLSLSRFPLPISLLYHVKYSKKMTMVQPKRSLTRHQVCHHLECPSLQNCEEYVSVAPVTRSMVFLLQQLEKTKTIVTEQNWRTCPAT